MNTTSLAVLAMAWAAGRPLLETGSLAVAITFPQLAAWAIPPALLRGVRARRTSRSADVLVLLALSAEMRAGATTRAAMIDVCNEDPRLIRASTLARAGRPMTDVLEAAAEALGRYGALTSAALGMASQTGGSVAEVMDQLVAQVMALDDLDRERKAAMAPILLQAAIVGGVPTIALVGMAVSGRLIELAAAGPVEAGIVAVGSGLVLLGALSVARISQRAGHV